MELGLFNGLGMEEPSNLEITTPARITRSLEDLLLLKPRPSSREEISHILDNRSASSSTQIDFDDVLTNLATTLSILLERDLELLLESLLAQFHLSIQFQTLFELRLELLLLLFLQEE